MIGQRKLLNLINSYTMDSFPRSSIIIGENGCGKHTLVKKISDKLNLELIDITENLNLDYLNEIYLKSIPAIYLIDGNIINEKQQNIILKFIEEPLKNSYIIIICEAKNILLETVINRCMLFEFEEYTKEELLQFVDDKNIDLLLSICKTPGQIMTLKTLDVESLYDLCYKVVTKLQEASLVNTLSISHKINYKDEYEKYDLMLFINMLINVLCNKIVEEDNKQYIFIYKETMELRNKLSDKRLNKQHIFENYLVKLWLGVH